LAPLAVRIVLLFSQKLKFPEIETFGMVINIVFDDACAGSAQFALEVSVQ